MRILVLFSMLLSACASKKPPNGPDVLVENQVDVEVADEGAFPPLLSEHGLGPWRLGMSRFDVLTQGNCKEFEADRFTGGFFCKSWDSPLGPLKISFAFDRQYRLEKIELTLFDGENTTDVQPVWASSLEAAVREIALENGVDCRTHPGQMSLDSEAFRDVLVTGALSTPFSMLYAVERPPENAIRTWVTVVASERNLHAFLFVAR